MSGNIIGKRFVVVSFGESHGKCIGCVIDGCPAGLELKEEDVQRELDLRKPGQSLVTTQRSEKDKVEIMSGVFNGYTTGAPIMMLIRNEDKDSSSYEAIKNTPRPSHADYVAKVKYGNFNDYRGGGRFSGRITASFVMAGSVAKKLLKRVLGTEIIAYSLEIAGIKAEGFDLEKAKEFRYQNEVRAPEESSAKKMMERILELKREGDSAGGIVECTALNVPVGLGEPVFDSFDSDLSKILFSIPAVKGVEFGSGFAASRLRGSENNDPITVREGKIITERNNSGGVVGGLSNGMPIVFRVAFKPAASISRKQKTVDLEKLEEVELIVPGRHDPSVVPRAVPVVEAATAITLADHAIRAGFIPPVLKGR